MAGVPAIMQSMMDNLAPRLRSGAKLHVASVATDIKEGDAAGPLRSLQETYADVSIGSYPFYNDQTFGTNVVCRGKDRDLVVETAHAVADALRAAGANTQITLPD